MFDAVKTKNDIVKWIQDWFKVNGPGCNAIVGISGGKDSSVVAALCAEALGAERVIGVLMPNHTQEDINYSHLLCDYLGIKNYTIDVGIAIDDLLHEIKCKIPENKISNQTAENLPPRIRMATLYAVSQSVNGRVSNTCNLSENYVGYSTRYGDNAGDFSPLENLTVGEVKAIGCELGLPVELIEKIPSDGLCGKTDEDKLGFTYEVLDRYIRTGLIDDKVTKERIDDMHKRNLFKMQLIPSFPYPNN